MRVKAKERRKRGEEGRWWQWMPGGRKRGMRRSGELAELLLSRGVCLLDAGTCGLAAIGL